MYLASLIFIAGIIQRNIFNCKLQLEFPLFNLQNEINIQVKGQQIHINFLNFPHYVSCWISAFYSELKAVWGAPRLLPKKNPYLWLLNAVLKIRNILLEAISRLDLSLWSWYLTFYLSPVISYLLSLSQQQRSSSTREGFFSFLTMYISVCYVLVFLSLLLACIDTSLSLVSRAI